MIENKNLGEYKKKIMCLIIKEKKLWDENKFVKNT